MRGPRGPDSYPGPPSRARGRGRTTRADARAALGGQRRRAEVVLHGFVLEEAEVHHRGVAD